VSNNNVLYNFLFALSWSSWWSSIGWDSTCWIISCCGCAYCLYCCHWCGVDNAVISWWNNGNWYNFWIYDANGLSCCWWIYLDGVINCLLLPFHWYPFWYNGSNFNWFSGVCSNCWWPEGCCCGDCYCCPFKNFRNWSWVCCQCWNIGRYWWVPCQNNCLICDCLVGDGDRCWNFGNVCGGEWNICSQGWAPCGNYNGVWEFCVIWFNYYYCFVVWISSKDVGVKGWVPDCCWCRNCDYGAINRSWGW